MYRLLCQLRQKVNIPPSPHYCTRPAPRRERKRSSESSSSIANSSPSSNKEKGRSSGKKKGEKGMEIKELDWAFLDLRRSFARIGQSPSELVKVRRNSLKFNREA
ncbi:unnamed protein product [Cuscuta epithymum]|uniref:Uncharacterized protein n=2 Tax=Cuscuta epithymum TaxID=186058 RepID=A0AAV0FZI6_9ASTE|nr:unnamed protein product [Cuscuta epithymum]